MAFIKRNYERGIPHEPGCVLVFNELTGGQLDGAQTAAQFAAIKQMKALEGAGVDIDALVSPEARAKADAAKEDKPWSGYDEDTLLKHGCVGGKGEGYDGVDFDPLALDRATRRFALTVIAEDNIRPPDSAPSSGT